MAAQNVSYDKQKCLTKLLAMANIACIKTPHGVLSKQFRYPGVKGK
ncbi:phage protein [Escherichia albertii KF1]|nr:phage protein [Escherichia albertii KF1]